MAIGTGLVCQLAKLVPIQPFTRASRMVALNKVVHLTLTPPQSSLSDRRSPPVVASSNPMKLLLLSWPNTRIGSKKHLMLLKLKKMRDAFVNLLKNWF